MVYRGRPSTGCRKCRERKIKCDERPQGCVKCADRGYTCPGYQNQTDLLFHDESAHVKAKAIKSKAKAVALRNERHAQAQYRSPTLSAESSESEESDEVQEIGRRCPDPFSISMADEDEAINFFMRNMAIGVDQPSINSVFYNQHLATNGFAPIVATSMTALGLAGIANIAKDAHLKREAARWYTKALRSTNSALADSVLSKEDNTLLSIMLLGVFEQVDNERSIVPWATHVDGAASLLRARGRSQFATASARRMYMQNISLLIMNCFAKGVPVPKYVHILNKELRKGVDESEPAWIFFTLNLEATELRAKILNGELTDLHEIIDRALDLDRRTEEMFVGSGLDYKYDEVPVEPGSHPFIFGETYHIYRHYMAAQTWNWHRHVRIYFQDVVRNALILGFSMTPPAFVGAKYTKIFTESTQILYKMQADILASIPQHLFDTPSSPPARSAHKFPSPPPERDLALRPLPSSSQMMDGPVFPKRRFLWENFREHRQVEILGKSLPTSRLPFIKVSGGYGLLWSIFMAGATSVATPESQKYVIETLVRIADEFGINQGKVLAQALNVKIKMDQSGESPFSVAPLYFPMRGPHVQI